MKTHKYEQNTKNRINGQHKQITKNSIIVKIPPLQKIQIFVAYFHKYINSVYSYMCPIQNI